MSKINKNLGKIDIYTLSLLLCSMFSCSNGDNNYNNSAINNEKLLDGPEGEIFNLRAMLESNKISKDTIENLVSSVAKGYQDTQEINTRVELDKENNVNVFVNLTVTNDAIIKDLSVNLQNDIKQKVKNATDLEVKEVNIKIKDISNIQQNK